MITLTERAAKEVQNYKSSVQAPAEDFLRIRLMAGGWCSRHRTKANLNSGSGYWIRLPHSSWH